MVSVVAVRVTFVLLLAEVFDVLVLFATVPAEGTVAVVSAASGAAAEAVVPDAAAVLEGVAEDVVEGDASAVAAGVLAAGALPGELAS